MVTAVVFRFRHRHAQTIVSRKIALCCIRCTTIRLKSTADLIVPLVSYTVTPSFGRRTHAIVRSVEIGAGFVLRSRWLSDTDRHRRRSDTVSLRRLLGSCMR